MLSLLLACAHGGAARTEGERYVEADAGPPAGASVPTTLDPVTTAPSTVALEIGLTSMPAISRAARAANAKGLEHHRAGRFEAASERFAAAIATSPDHDLARFNLACALTKLGRVDEAAAELATLLVRDPVRFVPRLRSDGDLAALREAPQGTRLEAAAVDALAALEAAYRGAIGASMYRPAPLVPYEKGARQGGALEHVTGIYVPSTRRFVPLVHGGGFGIVDVPGRRAVSIDTELCEAVSDGTSRRVRLDVLDLDDLAAPRRFDIDRGAVALTGDDFPFEGMGDCAYAVGVDVRGDGHGKIWFELEWHDGRDHNPTKWFLLDDGRATAATTAPPVGPTLSIARDGATIWVPPPAGHVVRGRAYRPPGASEDVRLGRAHGKPGWQSVVVTPDDRFAFVTSVREEMRESGDDDEEWFVRHAVARVELATAGVTVWAEGSGTAATLVADDGSIYVDAGGIVRRWASGDAKLDDAEKLMQGLHLAPFLNGEWCDRCG